MKENGITQYYLLKKSGLDNKTLSNIKKNGNITLLTKKKICKALKYTPNDIICLKD